MNIKKLDMALVLIGSSLTFMLAGCSPAEIRITEEVVEDVAEDVVKQEVKNEQT